jgi:DNA-binding response OmpR family regulator
VRILIVQDEYAVAAALELILTAGGHEVVGSTAKAKTALELAEKRRPDLAVSDIGLAGRRDGVELAAELHAGGTACLFVTANEARALRGRDHSLGCLLKPYKPRELLEAITVCETILKGEEPPADVDRIRNLRLYH